MPKIRLSALATDIKGKSGGSVFSSNAGGTYFRNNPSGGGKTSANWEKQKVNMSVLSSSWRNLSDEQKAVWEAQRSNYPTNNAFGESRLPSAYELYMRLNGVLLANGLPLLPVPLAPQSFTDLGEFEFFTPDKWAFTPQNAVVVGTFADDNHNFGWKYLGGDIPFDPAHEYSFFLRFQPILEDAVNTDDGLIFPLIQFGDTDADFLNLFIVQTSPNVWSLRLAARVGATTRQIVCPFIGNLTDAVNSVGVSINPANINQSVIRLNNNILTYDATPSLVLSTIDFDDEINIGMPDHGTIPLSPAIDFKRSSSIRICDVRLFADALSAQTWSRIHNGYRAAITAGWFSFANRGDRRQNNFGSSEVDAVFHPFNYPSPDPVYLPISFLFKPFLRLSWENPGAAGDYLAIYGSPALSPGRGSADGRFRRLITVPIENLTEIDFSDAWFNQWFGALNGTQIEIYADMIKGETGQSTTVGTTRKNVVRFKAGADLSSQI